MYAIFINEFNFKDQIEIANLIFDKLELNIELIEGEEYE